MKRITSTLVFFLLLIVLSIPSYYSKVEYKSLVDNRLRSSTISGKIHINNNWTVAKSTGICTGAGIKSDPYLIKNLIIDAGGVGHGLHIENTIEYFQIENCTAYNSGGGPHDGGIKLVNVSNGILVNNTTYDNYQGMSIYSSTNLLIIKNRFYNLNGIELVYTNDSVLYLNNFANDLIEIYFSWSFNKYNSQEKYSYTYHGRSFTNYLGNYWSRYDGLDENNDGLGDTERFVGSHFHNATLTDNYPLMEPIDNYINISPAGELIPGYNIIIIITVLNLTTLYLSYRRKKGRYNL